MILDDAQLDRLVRHFHFQVPCQYCIAWDDEGGCGSDATEQACREEIFLALGLDPSGRTSRRVRWNRDTIVHFLKQHSRDGRAPQANYNQNVYKAAKREFGSWNAAIKAAGLQPPLQGHRAHRRDR